MTQQRGQQGEGVEVGDASDPLAVAQLQTCRDLSG